MAGLKPEQQRLLHRKRLKMNKKGFALFLAKPFLWFLYILIVVIFLIIFTLAGFGSSDRDYSVVGEKMPEFIATIEAMNYLKTPVGDATVYDMLLRAISENGIEEKIDINSAELELLTNSFIEVKNVEIEDEVYTVRIAVNKAGDYKKIHEVILYLPSTIKASPYIKLIIGIPYLDRWTG